MSVDKLVDSDRYLSRLVLKIPPELHSFKKETSHQINACESFQILSPGDCISTE